MTDTSQPLYIVTGASTGIGRAVAAALATRGFRVVAVARSVELLNSLAATSGPSLTGVVADLATSEGVAHVIAAVTDDADIAGIVHAAGSLVPLEPYQGIDSNELVEHFRIHVGAPIALYRALTASHRIGRMLFIDSYSATTGRMGWAAYSIVKSAAQMAARCASQELVETDTIRVFPGAVNTRIVDAVMASETETATAFAGMLERGEFAEPAEAAAFIVAILADASDQLIRSREAWDYNNLDDHAAVG